MGTVAVASTLADPTMPGAACARRAWSDFRAVGHTRRALSGSRSLLPANHRLSPPAQHPRLHAACSRNPAPGTAVQPASSQTHAWPTPSLARGTPPAAKHFALDRLVGLLLCICTRPSATSRTFSCTDTPPQSHHHVEVPRPCTDPVLATCAMLASGPVIRPPNRPSF